jgi:hypothetical protein
MLLELKEVNERHPKTLPLPNHTHTPQTDTVSKLDRYGKNMHEYTNEITSASAKKKKELLYSRW